MSTCVTYHIIISYLYISVYRETNMSFSAYSSYEQHTCLIYTYISGWLFYERGSLKPHNFSILITSVSLLSVNHFLNNIHNDFNDAVSRV